MRGSLADGGAVHKHEGAVPRVGKGAHRVRIVCCELHLHHLAPQSLQCYPQKVLGHDTLGELPHFQPAKEAHHRGTGSTLQREEGGQGGSERTITKTESRAARSRPMCYSGLLPSRPTKGTLISGAGTIRSVSITIGGSRRSGAFDITMPIATEASIR